MQNFKKIKSRIILLFFLFMFLVGGILFLKLCFSGQLLTEMYINRMEKLEQKKKNIDILFLGGSRIYRSFDPDIFDEKLGCENTTNCGSPSQKPSFSYFLLEDFLEKFTPKYVCIGMTYNGMQGEQEKKTISWTMDRIKFKNRINALVRMYGCEGLLVATGKSEYSSNLSLKDMNNNLKNKTMGYVKELMIDDTIKKSNGFSNSFKKMQLGGISQNNISVEFDKENISEKTRCYYDEMINLCKKKGITVYLVSGPCSCSQLYKVKNYQGAVDYFNNYAKKMGVKYFNLNYIKNREDIISDNEFKDYLHLNYFGAQRISKLFAKILKDEINGKETKKYFYSNFNELKKDVNRVVSCSSKIEKIGEKIRIQVSSYHNDNVLPEYRILASNGMKDVNKNETYEELQGWSKSESRIISYEKIKKYNNIKVEARINENDDYYAFSIISTDKIKDKK